MKNVVSRGNTTLQGLAVLFLYLALASAFAPPLVPEAVGAAESASALASAFAPPLVPEAVGAAESASKVFSVDLPVITSSTPFQMAVTGSLSFTVIGTSFSSSTFITRVRISLSASESEGWLYDSSILCKIAALGNTAVNGNITGKSSRMAKRKRPAMCDV
jgi:hypothetical protein